jgi:hypothetical protein
MDDLAKRVVRPLGRMTVTRLRYSIASLGPSLPMQASAFRVFQPLLVRSRRMVPSGTHHEPLIWRPDSPNAWVPSVGIGPLEHTAFTRTQRAQKAIQSSGAIHADRPRTRGCAADRQALRGWADSPNAWVPSVGIGPLERYAFRCFHLNAYRSSPDRGGSSADRQAPARNLAKVQRVTGWRRGPGPKPERYRMMLIVSSSISSAAVTTRVLPV